MEELAEHARQTWTHEGLEVRGCGSDSVKLSVGPSFPVSALCADLAAVFDAEVALEHDKVQGTMLVVTTNSSERRSAPTGKTWVTAAVFAVIVAVAKGAVMSTVLPLDKLKEIFNLTNATLWANPM